MTMQISANICGFFCQHHPENAILQLISKLGDPGHFSNLGPLVWISAATFSGLPQTAPHGVGAKKLGFECWGLKARSERLSFSKALPH